MYVERYLLKNYFHAHVGYENLIISSVQFPNAKFVITISYPTNPSEMVIVSLKMLPNMENKINLK